MTNQPMLFIGSGIFALLVFVFVLAITLKPSRKQLNVLIIVVGSALGVATIAFFGWLVYEVIFTDWLVL